MTSPFTSPELTVHSESRSLELVHTDGSAHSVDQNPLRIGASEICEIQLSQGPLLHSVVHHESGIVWIEADIDVEDLFVNGRCCRRMALRDGDIINAGGLEMTLRYRDSLIPDLAAAEGKDVSQMSAEELCDRILEEQTEVEAYESATRQGWENLMSAIKAVHQSEQDQVADPIATENDPAPDACERLLDQIREISELVNGRSKELDDTEAELAAATALLHESQDQVSRQIEELFEQFSDLPLPNEMRASA